MIVLTLTLFLVNGVYPGTVVINTDLHMIKATNLATDVQGSLSTGYFTDRNNYTWSYETSNFTLHTIHSGLFAHGNNVTVRGIRPLVINSSMNLVINTTIDISAVPVLDKNITSHLGGYTVNMNNCCYVGSGPGGGISYHGGGHGGAGGGSWRDPEYNISYGKPYTLFGEVIGGSTGAFIYDSDPGTGGGAIQIIVDGELTIGSHGKIVANGFTVANTTENVCSGASAGGRILIKAKKVNLEGRLEANGGHAGWSNNLSNYCSDGGGGGVIHIKTDQLHRATSSSIRVDGGKGLSSGENGIIKGMTIPNKGMVFVNTETCRIENNSVIIQGNISDERGVIGCETLDYKICTFLFADTLTLGINSMLMIQGENALRLVSQNGDINVSTKLNIGGGDASAMAKQKWLGGFFNLNDHYAGPGSDKYAAAHGNLTNPRSYGINPVLLIGGSSCTDRTLSTAVGGGAIALEAPKGTIFVNANITANAYAQIPLTSCGASGGTIVLKAKNVYLNAFVEANGCDGQYVGGDGGVVSVTQGDRRNIKVNPGRGRGNSHGNSNGKKGIIIEDGNSPQFLARQTSCFSTSPSLSAEISTTQTSLIASSAVNTEISLARSQSSVKVSASNSIYELEESPTGFLTYTNEISSTAALKEVISNIHSSIDAATVSLRPSEVSNSKSPSTEAWSTTPVSSTSVSLSQNDALATQTSLFTSNAVNTEISLARSQSSVKQSASNSIYELEESSAGLLTYTNEISSTAALKEVTSNTHSSIDAATVSLRPSEIVKSKSPSTKAWSTTSVSSTSVSLSQSDALASTSIYVAAKTSTQALKERFQSTSSTLHGVTISESSVLSSCDKSWDLKCTDSNLSTSELQINPTPSSTYRAVQSTSVIIPTKNTVSPEFKKFTGVVVNKQSTLNVSQQLFDAVQNTSSMTANDTLIALDLIEQMASSSVFVPTDRNEGETVARNILRSCAKIAKVSHESESHDGTATETVPRITETLESFGEGIGSILEKNETFLIQDETIAFEVTNIDTETPKEMSFPVSPKAKQRLDNNVTIPKEIFASAPANVSVILVIMNINGTYNKSNSLNGSSVQTISNIISIRLSSGKLHSLGQPIVLRHKVPKQIPKNREIRGGYWQSRSKSSSRSGWSYKGCSSTKKGDSLETKSSHMTSFAVLMSVKKVPIAEVHTKALLLITYIGCGISLFGLLLTFATFVTLDTLDQERTAIHCNLVVALGFAQVIFLAGIQATDNRAACTTVAVLLHYFFTAAFSWMFAEGVHLYKKVVSVFSHGSKLKFYYVIGWGLPVIIVALSAGIRPDGYGNQNACWISLDGGLIWAFVAPVIIVMIINMIVMIIVVKILMSSVSTVQVDSKTKQQMNRSTQQIKAGAKAMVILMPILGLSWIFGLLAVNESTIIFQYLFCIFNSLQGLFIFLVHCVGNSEVRSAFKRLHEKHTLSKSIGEKSIVVKSMEKFSQKSRPGSVGDEILVQREMGSIVSSIGEAGERTVTPKTISAGQISLNSLNCPMTNIDYQDDTFA